MEVFMRKLWIVVANSSYAHIFDYPGLARNIRVLHTLDHPDGRKRGRDVYSDKPTRSFESVGNMRHATMAEVDFHTHTQEVFAKQMAELLRKGADGGNFTELAIIAPPAFLGIIKNSLSKSVAKTVTFEINKDIPEAMDEKKRIDMVVNYLDLP